LNKITNPQSLRLLAERGSLLASASLLAACAINEPDRRGQNPLPIEALRPVVLVSSPGERNRPGVAGSATATVRAGDQAARPTGEVTGAVRPALGNLPVPRDSAKTRRNPPQQLAYDGLNLLADGDVAGASSKFNAALRLTPTEANFHLLNAVAYHLDLLNGNGAAAELARQGYDMAIQYSPSNWLGYFLRGRLRMDQQDHRGARADFAEALLFESNEPQLLLSMASASYQHGDVTTAVAMIDRLDKLKALSGTKELQAAAMIYAAIGRTADAERIARQMATGGEPQAWRAEQLHRRIVDWARVHEASAVPIKIQTRADLASSAGSSTGDTLMAQAGPPDWQPGGSPYGQPGGSPYGQPGGSPYGQPGGPPDGQPGGPTTLRPGAAVFSDPTKSTKMVIVDVVIIQTDETVATAKGFNLLRGLQLNFGLPASVTGTPAWSRSTSIVTDPAKGTPSAITRQVSLSGLSYSLNIFNATGQRNEILARPTIVAMADQVSDFFAGVELTAAAVGSGNAGGQAVQIQKQIGVSLAVKPAFLPDGRVQLSVQAERTFIKTPSPDVIFSFRLETSKTRVNSNVVMRYGETLILSGLSEKESENVRDGVPVLQDIPLIQYAFSQGSTKEFQKSVLILLTPRPAEYVYQPEAARIASENELSADERPIANLRARYTDWFKPYPNWASVFNHLQSNSLYREFRTGDVELERWSSSQSLMNRLKQSIDFLWY
jgi:Flp pilus assembly protein TadD